MEMKEIFRIIAEENGVTPEEIYAEIQDCILEAYRTAPEGSIEKMNQNRVPRKGEIPTPEEMIDFIVAEMQRKHTLMS